MDNLKAAALIIGTLAEEAGIDESELPTITLVAFACRVVIARARKQAAARTVVAEPPCPFGDA